jgi:hypothetical protein
MKIGFIGVGNIGAPIAGQLLKAGHALVVHDSRREAANALLAAGAAWLRGDFEPRFSLALARKDLGLAQELARATDTPMRLGALCEKEMIEAMARGWADRVFWGTDITRMPCSWRQCVRRCSPRTDVAPGPRSRAGHGRGPVQLGGLAPSRLSAAIGQEFRGSRLPRRLRLLAMTAPNRHCEPTGPRLARPEDKLSEAIPRGETQT